MLPPAEGSPLSNSWQPFPAGMKLVESVSSFLSKPVSKAMLEEFVTGRVQRGPVVKAPDGANNCFGGP